VIAASAFLRTRRLQLSLRTRTDVELFQARRVKRFLRQIAPRVLAFRGLDARSLADLPIMDKAQLMSSFHRYNRPGVTAEQARQAMALGARVRGLTVGASTGTGGNRGLYLVSDHERFMWLGVILAKALPDVVKQRHRVAIVLPANSRLYDAANESGRLSLAFFDLSLGLDPILAPVAAFAPTVIVAPPKALTALARADLALSPQRLFSVAEVLDPLDRRVVESRFCLTLGQIYMATEGLFAVSCSHGGLHLAEDVAAFEWECAPGSSGLAAPIVTDFTRVTQVMARYRMNDLLSVSDASCDCGSPFQLVSEIVGRMDDVFILARRGGQGALTLTPDVIRNAVVAADPGIEDFRVQQVDAGHIVLRLPPGPADQLALALLALRRLIVKAGAEAEVIGERVAFSAPTDRKLRRVIGMTKAAS
jgi:putative adenylate-forming enzyme